MLRVTLACGLVGAIFCTTALSDPSKLITVVHETIPNTEYSIYTNQTLTLTYDAYVIYKIISYPGVFAMDLKKKMVEGSNTFLKNEDFELF